MKILLHCFVIGLLVSSAVGGVFIQHESGNRGSQSSLGSRATAATQDTSVHLGASTAFPPRGPHAISAVDPWPVGITDFGFTDGGTTEYTTTSFLANASISGLSTSGSGSVGSEMGFQLNVNLGYEAGGNWYVYWIQDVAIADTATQSIFEYVDNIWNFSANGASVYSSSVTGNGLVSSDGGQGFYWDAVYAAPVLTYPGNLRMMVNATVNAFGQPVVQFMYDDGAGFVTYDSATFAFVRSLDYSDGFIVDGASYNPTGYLYYDAEFVMCGPGGGSSTTDESSAVDLFLQYWNGYNYETINDATNYGFDTAETIASADAQGYYYTASGELFSQVAAGSESQSAIWYSSELSKVEIEGPGSSNAVLDSGSLGTSYLAGYGEIATWPVSIYFYVDCSGFTQNLGTPTLSGGTTTVLSTGLWADLNFGQRGLPGSASWGVSIGEEYGFGTEAVVSFYVPVGSYSYMLMGGHGYLPSPSAGLISVGSTGEAETISWSLIAVASSRGTADVGQMVQFDVTLLNTSGDIFSWSGLPRGCEGGNVPALTCTPTSSGIWELSVSVTDANGFVATSGLFDYTVYPNPAIASINFTPTDSILQGRIVTMTANTTPGSGGLVYNWSGLPPGCQPIDSLSVMCAPSATGTWTISLLVTDTNGGIATSDPVTLTVRPSFLGLPALEGYVIVGVIVSVIAALAAAALLVGSQRGKGRKELHVADGMAPDQGEFHALRLGPSVAPNLEEQTGYTGPVLDIAAGVTTAESEMARGDRSVGLNPGAVYLGTPLGVALEPLCWNCHKQNLPESRYCSRCGIPLRAPTSR